MLGRFRRHYEEALRPLGNMLAKSKVSPNLLTVLGLAVASVCGYTFYIGLLLQGLLLMLIAGFIDMLDGAVARACRSPSRFGDVLDRVVDRYIEYMVLLGLMAGGFIDWFWGLFALFGMLMASYARASAEASIGEGSCSVGLMERQEKFLLIIVGVILTPFIPQALNYSAFLIGFLSHITVVQRLKHAHTVAKMRV